MRITVIKFVLSLAVMLVMTGCATTGTVHTGDDQSTFAAEKNIDPFETFNRKVFAFNQDFDNKILIPLAKGYRKNIPSPVRTAIYNFFINIAEARNVVNSLLQGKLHRASDAFTRLFVNTTLGLGGLIDIATQSGLERQVEDIGQTLAVWGFDSGPYIVIPVIGPSSGRDIFGLYSYFNYTDPLGYLDDSGARFVLFSLDLVDYRSRLLRAKSVFGFASVDPYLFERESYFQTRRDMIYDGRPPIEEY